jgi:hypothetical protein
MLTLPIKKKWFDMIKSGEKKEEYREIKPYYTSRFFNEYKKNNHNLCFHVIFRNGYSKNSPSIKCYISLYKDLTGRPEWGAEPNKLYYVLKILSVEEIKSMKTKDLKINFRYLVGNIACLSVDSIDGKSIHNDINNEEAIIIFNSLVGEKENCQTVKKLLQENQELKEKLDKYENPKDMTLFAMWCTEKVKDENQELKLELSGYRQAILNNKEMLGLKEQNEKLKKQLENCYCNRTDCSGRIKDSKVYDSLVQKVETQQKEFIEWLEAMSRMYENEYKDIDTAENYNCVLEKYKEIIGGIK